MIHLRIYAAVLVVLTAFLGAAIIHSRVNRPQAHALTALKTVSPLLPSADPGMDNSARYIRHLGLSTPGSAFPDYPAQPDYMLSGLTWPPPLPFLGISTRLDITGSAATGGAESR